MNYVQLNEEIAKLKTAKNNIISSISSFGIVVPDNVKIDEISTIINNIECISTISFDITLEDGISIVHCIAEEGMTFGSWIYSDYYTDDIKESLGQLTINTDYYNHIVLDNDIELYTGGDEDVWGDTLIVNEGLYYLSSQSGIL